MKVVNRIGLSFGFLESGALSGIEAGPIRIGLQPATPFSKSGANLFLRKRKKPFKFIPLTGPESPGRFAAIDDHYLSAGTWEDLDYSCRLQLSEASMSWQWVIDIRNNSKDRVEMDLVYLQDAGLKTASAGLMNELYVSQYTERRILEDDMYGTVICCRQNMKEATGYPWMMMACLNGAASASTDGMQFYGKKYRETGIPEGLLEDHLGGECAGESSILSLQSEPFFLDPAAQYTCTFIATFLPDHPAATSEEDLIRIPGLVQEFSGYKEIQATPDLRTPVRNLFITSSFLPVEDLTEPELDRFFGTERRHCEWINDRLLSFFYGPYSHVMLHPKEMLTDRPHGHIMQANTGFMPDESIMSVTSFAFGVFASHISQGNTNFNVLLSVCSSPFNLARESGQRIFVEFGEGIYLLGVPSAFESGLNYCRWIYKHGESIFQVRTWTSANSPEIHVDFRVINGRKVRMLFTHDPDDSGKWTFVPGKTPDEFIARPGVGTLIAGKFPGAQFRLRVNHSDTVFQGCDDEVLYPDFRSHGSRLFVLEVDETATFSMSFIGEVCRPAAVEKVADPEQRWLSDVKNALGQWKDLSLDLELKGENEDLSAIREILPWFGMNALTHFLTPYGLEQFSGAAWGTRDIAQGPFDMLLFSGKYEAARKVLCIIFSNQNNNGGWPQWWMFDRYSFIRADSSHGDIFYWCILALSNYIKVTGDLGILDEVLPYYPENDAGPAEKTPLSEHVDRLIRMITASFIEGTSLVPFSGGDWNDSLQPVSKELARRMISSWTVEMNYQAFDQYRRVYEMKGDLARAKELSEICEKIKTDFNKYLIGNGIVAGYGLVEEDRTIRLLLHPDDEMTHIRYSILPMERGILSGIFTKEQAEFHLDLIEKHLKGPDGARLMDRPLKYKGGIQEVFQRAESSTFFGREIGLMYVHEHIRYAEVQARMGRAEAFVKALRQANPVGYRDIVACADYRQSNCYYSSSDVTFRSRYEADELYEKVISGELTLKGGWRVYSSGPGIYVGIVVMRLLGVRIEQNKIIIDPVMPLAFNGLSASMNLMNRPVTFHFSVKENGFSPKSISINGKLVSFIKEDNTYRDGGAVIALDPFLAMLDRKENVIEVLL